MVQTYRVIWEIDIDANTPLEAARKARALQTEEDSIANVFDVVDEHGDSTQIDLEEEMQDANDNA